MKNRLRSHLLALALLPASLAATEPAKNDGCACCQGKETCCCHDDHQAAGGDGEKTSAPAERHPLKGRIVDVYPAKSALMVKHEAIPGVMHAMTMLFKVDAATLRTVQKGDTITATLVERDGEYYLEDVKPVSP